MLICPDGVYPPQKWFAGCELTPVRGALSRPDLNDIRRRSMVPAVEQVDRPLACSGLSVRSGGGSVSVLDGGPDGDIADLDVVRLLDRKGDGAGHGIGTDTDRGHPELALFPDVRIVHVMKELGTDEAG